MELVAVITKAVLRKVLPKDSSGLSFFFTSNKLPMILPARQFKEVPAFMGLAFLVDFQLEARGIEKRKVVIGVPIGEFL